MKTANKVKGIDGRWKALQAAIEDITIVLDAGINPDRTTEKKLSAIEIRKLFNNLHRFIIEEKSEMETVEYLRNRNVILGEEDSFIINRETD